MARMTEEPSYWAVIPAAVRYDKDLPPNAKLLYGEVTALTDKRGYCYAHNSYFVELFGLSERSITRLLAILVDRGYLRIDVVRDSETQEVLERRIYAVYDKSGEVPPPPDNFVRTPPDIFDGTPPDKNVGENNTSIDHIPPIVPQGGQAKKKKAKSVPKWKPERFEKFWAFYPRHEDRVSAVREWDRLKPSDQLIDEIARALLWQTKDKDWATPYACRYLKNQRWMDEPSKPSVPQPPSRPAARQMSGWHMEVINGEEVMVPDGSG
ncbi:MAG TPA: helix-turn-helix domain-containing protein [Candidatus Flavonifractor merdavium]|nr:helix-turn-helix domain-containing protein [Candidatus Flavonifractor merdavium]